MDTEVYRQSTIQRGFFYVVICFMALVGVPIWIASLLSGDLGQAGFMTLWVGILVLNGYRFLGGPRQIELMPDRIRLVGWRSREIPWGSLRSISSPWYDLNRLMWRWEWDGGGLTTLGNFERQHKLLTSIEAHAPHVDINI